jgi:hypothetical protein
MEKIETQLFDKDTGLITQFTDTRDWQRWFNRSVIGAFVVSMLSLGVWLIQHLRS